MQVVMLSGYLARDPVYDQSEDGRRYAVFSMADNRKFINRDGDEDERTVWFDIWSYGDLADNVNSYLTKGRFISMWGELMPPRFFRPKNLPEDAPWEGTVQVRARQIHFGPIPGGSWASGADDADLEGGAEDVDFDEDDLTVGTPTLN